MVDLSDAEIEEAEARGRMMIETAPRASAVSFDPVARRVLIELTNGRASAFPPHLIQDLHGAGGEDLAAVEVDGLGFNLHWPTLEVDLYVPALISGIFGTRAWMARKASQAA